MTDNQPPVDFPVWDVRSPLAPADPYVTAAGSGGGLTSLSLRRGGQLGAAPALATFSMPPALAASDPAYLTRMALLAFFDGLAPADPGGFMDDITRMSFGVGGGEPATLMILGEQVPAVSYPPAEGCWVVRSVDPRFGVAVAGSQVEVPAVTAADWPAWAGHYSALFA
jgi:hypothetical protein